MFTIDDNYIIYDSANVSVYELNIKDIKHNFREKYYIKSLEVQAETYNYSNFFYHNKDN